MSFLSCRAQWQWTYIPSSISNRPQPHEGPFDWSSAKAKKGGRKRGSGGSDRGRSGGGGGGRPRRSVRTPKKPRRGLASRLSPPFGDGRTDGGHFFASCEAERSGPGPTKKKVEAATLTSQRDGARRRRTELISISLPSRSFACNTKRGE